MRLEILTGISGVEVVLVNRTPVLNTLPALRVTETDGIVAKHPPIPPVVAAGE